MMLHAGPAVHYAHYKMWTFSGSKVEDNAKLIAHLTCMP